MLISEDALRGRSGLRAAVVPDDYGSDAIIALAASLARLGYTITPKVVMAPPAVQVVLALG